MKHTNVLILGNVSRRSIIGGLRLFNERSDVSVYFGFEKRTVSQNLLLLSFKHVKPVKLRFSTEFELIQSLIELSRTIGRYFILPSDEEYIRIILKSKSRLESFGILIRSPELSDYIKISDKESFTHLCLKYNIPVPQMCEFPNSYISPFVLKPIRHIQNKSVLKFPVLIENKKIYDRILNKNLELEAHFCQSYIFGPSYYYCAFYQNGKKLLSFSQFNSHQQPNGKSIFKAHPAEIDENLTSRIDHLFSDLGWEGVMMFELKKELSSGKFYAIECNPRLWGPIQLCIDNGIDFFSPLAYLESSTKPLELKKYGYVWYGGYISGLFLRIKTKCKFQIFKDKEMQNYRNSYRDVWLRRDTILYFIADIFNILIEHIKPSNKK